MAAALRAALAMGLLAAARPAATAMGQRRQAELFLEKYGYFREPGSAHSPAEFTEALRDFQRVSHLPPSGLLDAPTLHQMSLPRCGTDDGDSRAAGTRRARRTAQHGGRWYKRHLRYRVVNWPSYLPQHEVRLAVRAAFELWSNVSSLLFWEAQDGPADIRLTFFHGDHNDGLNNAFDGPGPKAEAHLGKAERRVPAVPRSLMALVSPGGALAHAFFPLRGEAHFDSAERWSLHSGKGRNLFIVVAHEVGHTLGLQHSPVKSALMSPYYKKLSKDFVLSWDDILAVQNLYGKPSKGSAIQLPGKVFTHFQDWNTDLYSRDREQRSLSTYYCHSFFDAITADGDHNLYIFKGSHYWVVSASGNASEPRPLQPRWPGLPASIDACTWSQLTGKFYFFKGGRCWRYAGSKLEAGFPRKCSALGLPRHPDTALYFQQLRRLVLFKGPKYFVLGEEPLGVEPYYPRSLRDWAGLPPGTAGALTHRDGSLYFFRDEQYWKFDQNKLRVVASGKWAAQLAWMGCWDANSEQLLF
ncbi:matrix metalloproteinase-28 isoform X1 [Poecile atricapillus]|uniref:matrix metalloproteinase-28 isoform X1 n=1 Tax=Poecile atricapillus TaxID=48891 RepID=UPI002739577B|nr:matrix metalloproteinase-28 isoform X1 [Poecile atricapillus]